MRKKSLTMPSLAAPGNLPGKKRNRCAPKPPSAQSKHLHNICKPSTSLSPSWWTNRRLAGYYHPARSIVTLVELADQRILALDGPTNGEIAWNHLTPAERKTLALAIDRLQKV